MTGREWMVRAACRGLDPELWFPGPTDTPTTALRICGACAVREACTDYAIAEGHTHGIWGGLSERARVRLGKERRRAA